MHETILFSFFVSIIFLFLGGIVCLLLSYKHRPLLRLSMIIVVCGSLLFCVCIAYLWIHLARPPMRTIGETRLWYSFFLPWIGLVAYKRWNYRWFVLYCVLMSCVFLVLNLLHPENFSRTLMPALQSPWFIPHVILFMFSYAIFGGAAIIAFQALLTSQNGKNLSGTVVQQTDLLVRIGLALFTIAMLFGALWAKEAWGMYWTWDPKETWAFLTWCVYLIFLHLRLSRQGRDTLDMYILVIAFVVLLICWFGVNYLPAARSSIHVYS